MEHVNCKSSLAVRTLGHKVWDLAERHRERSGLDMPLLQLRTHQFMTLMRIRIESSIHSNRTADGEHLAASGAQNEQARQPMSSDARVQSALHDRRRGAPTVGNLTSLLRQNPTLYFPDI